MNATEKRTRLPIVDRNLDDGYFPDTGCVIHPSCLSCPMERCIYDEPQEGRRETQQRRDQAIYRQYLAQGHDIRALAERFGVSRRTVHRAVARMRGGDKR